MPLVDDTSRFTLRHLPLPARVTLAVFMIAIGFGYLAGLVQLHFAHSKSGQPLPTLKDIIDVFHGVSGPVVSRFERLIEAPENAPFNGGGTMRPAFTTKSGGWAKAIKDRPEAEVRKEREGERRAVLAWLHAGASKDEYEKDRQPLPDVLKDQPITIDFVAEEDGKKFILIKSLLDERCARCHTQGGADDKAAKYLLDSFDSISKYATPAKAEGMSLEKLAMFTHAHFLSFAMIYGVTGLIFALTRYPFLVRLLLAPLPLLAQLVEMASWWLVRLDPSFGYVILVTGGVVGFALLLQIMLTLFDLFAWKGRLVLLLFFVAFLAGAGYVKVTYIDPFLAAKQEAK